MPLSLSLSLFPSLSFFSLSQTLPQPSSVVLMTNIYPSSVSKAPSEEPNHISPRQRPAAASKTAKYTRRQTTADDLMHQMSSAPTSDGLIRVLASPLYLWAHSHLARRTHPRLAGSSGQSETGCCRRSNLWRSAKVTGPNRTDREDNTPDDWTGAKKKTQKKQTKCWPEPENTLSTQTRKPQSGAKPEVCEYASME